MTTTLHPIDSPAHQQWLRTEELRLLEFGRHVVRYDNLGSWLGDDGRPDPGQNSHTYITGRMAHIHYLGALRGVPGTRERAERLLRGLNTGLRDRTHGGWLDCDVAAEADKSAYAHAFVILASATGTIAGDQTAPALLAESLQFVDERFWEPVPGMFADVWSHDWSVRRPYRGINANMHLVEAMLAASDATGDPQWAQRALSVCRFVIDHAAANAWRIPEHYDEQWRPQLEYNAEHPDDQFKPYGATIGHAFEWSRLIACSASISGERDRFLDAAKRLYAQGVVDGWARNGEPGFVYTIDWSGDPVVADRLHWVAAEAIGAAATLARLLGEPLYHRDYMRWWDYTDRYLIDRERGSWHQQLTDHNEPASTIWPGKPDLYHGYQATLTGQLAPATSFAAAVSAS